MRICIDVSPAVHQRAGIGRYAYELAARLPSMAQEHRVTVFYNRAAQAQVAPPLDTSTVLKSELKDKPWRLRILLAHFTHLSLDRFFPGIDLFHATDHLLPRFSHIHSVFTLHDLTFRLYPQTHNSWNRWFLRLMMPRFLGAADAVIADSECTRQDAIRLYRIREDKIKVIHLGVSARFCPASAEAIADVRQKYALPERFILCVGTLEPRKNLSTLLEAYSVFRRNTASRIPRQEPEVDYPLVIAGKQGWRYQGLAQQLDRLGRENQVILTGFVDDQYLPALYSAATLFVYPSLYEGFGFPPLEAMACGTPVITSNASSLPEIVGDAGIMVAPHDTRGFSHALERILADTTKQREMREKGLRQAARFSWDKTVQETLAVYRATEDTEHDHRPGRSYCH